MTDQSNLDSMYFIDEYVFNCPFCKRGNVSYLIEHSMWFDWTKEKTCNIHIAICQSCNKRSMHLTYHQFGLTGRNNLYRFNLKEGLPESIDSYFFFSVPTSFFALDSRIPRVLRELFTEAEGCMKSNFLTGASACVRKIIYEIAVLEGATGNNYEERIKSLKKIRDDVDPEYFDTLLTIQQVTSDKVHEESYDGWRNEHLNLLLSTLNEILIFMYVVPEVKKEKRNAILRLKEQILGEKSDQGNTQDEIETG